ncbi:MAG TPA: hypothetical protein VGI17_08585, partial [Solirubrobacterales bacterium]
AGEYAAGSCRVLRRRGVAVSVACKRVSRASVLLAALTSEPTPTSDLYDRIGYPTLTRLGLVPYRAFRNELAGLAAAGLAVSQAAEDGSTTWRLSGPSGEDE